MKQIFFLMILSLAFSVQAQSSNSAKICLNLNMKDLMGKPVFNSKCEVTQRLTYQDSTAKWNCLVDGKYTLVDLFKPSAVGYDYNRFSGYVVYSYEKNDSPVAAMLRLKGYPKNFPFTTLAQNKIFFSNRAPATEDSVLYLKAATVTLELEVKLTPKYLTTLEKCF